jgi:putative transcriptional regulator
MPIMEPLSLTDHFLIAMPNMADPLFARSLVYLCEHGDHGAMGLIVNKPSGIAMAQLFDQIDLPLEIDPLRGESVFFGGPVQPDRGFVLHAPAGHWQSSLVVKDDMALDHFQGCADCRFRRAGSCAHADYLGYAGWSAGQLEQEISDNSWLTVKADPDILFDLPAESRYDAAMALLGFDPSLLSGDVGHA